MANEKSATTEEQLAELRRGYAELLQERNRLQQGLRTMFGIATYYIGAHQVDLKEYRANDPDLKARLDRTEAEVERVRHIMKVNGLTD